MGAAQVPEALSRGLDTAMRHHSVVQRFLSTKKGCYAGETEGGYVSVVLHSGCQTHFATFTS